MGVLIPILITKGVEVITAALIAKQLKAAGLNPLIILADTAKAGIDVIDAYLGTPGTGTPETSQITLPFVTTTNRTEIT
jgi:hypothetical protein